MNARGFSLLEVLVALTIAAFGLLGIASLQARSLSMQLDSESRRVAVGLVAQLRERVTANQEGYGQALGTGYTRTLDPGATVTVPPCANASACNAVTEVPPRQVAQWLLDVNRQLPGAAARVGPAIAGSSTSMSVTVGWIEPNAQAVAPDAACAAIASVNANPAYRCITVVLFPG